MGNGKLSVVEVRLRNGKRIFSRQFENVSPDQARDKVKGEGKVIGIRKVSKWELHELQFENNIASIVFGEQKKEVIKKPTIVESMTLEEILFPKKKSRQERLTMRKEYKEEV